MHTADVSLRSRFLAPLSIAFSSGKGAVLSLCLMGALLVCSLSGCSATDIKSGMRQDPVTSGAGGNQEAGAGQEAGGVNENVPVPGGKFTERSPDQYRVVFATTKGDFVVEVTRKWAPNAADRFHHLVKTGYFKDIAIFRAISGFMFQFGIHGDPAQNEAWGEARFKDDAYSRISNAPGRITFARTGAPDSRSSQLFINLGDNAFLDRDGFTPFGEVVEGIEVLTKINTEYGDQLGQVPDGQGEFQRGGNPYIKELFPNLDYITSVTLVDPNAPAKSDAAPAADAAAPADGGAAAPGKDGATTPPAAGGGGQ